MKLSKACHIICNTEKKKVVLANLDNGTWILIPLSCWKIIQKMDENNISPEEIYARAYDKEDNGLLINEAHIKCLNRFVDKYELSII